ncbi:MAG: carboxypeptidase regulatory-like domain-containing protein [Planctomycetes bacterium]|nr:carboxypeptidase regulatory-like domain-containing protein [Planctomycetota bacterium]
MIPSLRWRIAAAAAVLGLLAAVLLQLQGPDPQLVSPAPTTVERSAGHTTPVEATAPETSTWAREPVEAPLPTDDTAAPGHAAASVPTGNGRNRLTGHVLLDTRIPAVDATVRIGRSTTTTDATGAFGFSRKGIGENDALIATLQGYEPAVIPYLARTPAFLDGSELEVVLPGPACGIDGWLVDSSGAPCQGWRLELFGGTDCGVISHPNLLVEDLAAGATVISPTGNQQWDPPTPIGNPNLRTIGADGTFRIGGLRRGHEYVLRAWHVRSLQTVFSRPVPAGTSNYVFVAELAPSRDRVWGHTVDKFGAAIAGVRVRLTMREHQAGGWVSYQTGQQVSSAADGSFAFTDVPRQDLLLRFDGNGVEGLHRELRAADDGTDLRVQLACSCRFRYEDSSRGTKATTLRMLDRDERPLHIIRRLEAGRTLGSTSAAIEDGRSPELEVNDTATWLELRAGREVVAKIPVRLERGNVNVLR